MFIVGSPGLPLTAVVFFCLLFFFGALWKVPFQVIPSTIPTLQFPPCYAAPARIPVPYAFRVGNHLPEIQTFVVPPSTGVALVCSKATNISYMLVRVLR